MPVAVPVRLTLYVPHPESRLCRDLAHGSAIVGLPLGSGAVRIYYEGNVIGAVNLDRYRQKAAQAASRMLHNYPVGYPTRAREDVDPREVVRTSRSMKSCFTTPVSGSGNVTIASLVRRR